MQTRPTWIAWVTWAKCLGLISRPVLHNFFPSCYLEHRHFTQLHYPVLSPSPVPFPSCSFVFVVTCSVLIGDPLAHRHRLSSLHSTRHQTPFQVAKPLVSCASISTTANAQKLSFATFHSLSSVPDAQHKLNFATTIMSDISVSGPFPTIKSPQTSCLN